jgi:hypothetical protein
MIFMLHVPSVEGLLGRITYRLDWKKQLVRRRTLPAGLQKRIQPCPREIEHMLPPPPPGCANVLIVGHIVRFKKKTSIVEDIFHFEI